MILYTVRKCNILSTFIYGSTSEFQIIIIIIILPLRHQNCRSLTFDIKRGIYSPALVPEARNRT